MIDRYEYTRPRHATQKAAHNTRTHSALNTGAAWKEVVSCDKIEKVLFLRLSRKHLIPGLGTVFTECLGEPKEGRNAELPREAAVVDRCQGRQLLMYQWIVRCRCKRRSQRSRSVVTTCVLKCFLISMLVRTLAREEGEKGVGAGYGNVGD